jgi:LysR family transcriptional regulator, glycine cleavage system transcriptional activator
MSIDRRDDTRIRITGIPSHLTRWLAPRLHRFRAAYPGIELHISADLAMVDLTKRMFDVALRFGSGVYPGVHAEYLMDDAIIPVASPRYIAETGPIEKTTDLLQRTRILDVTAENDDSGTNWRTWFAYHRLPMHAIDRGMQFDGALIVLEAAAGGLGVAIARKSLVMEEIRSGRLVQVLPGEIRTNWRHYALTLHDMADWPPVRAFVDWLRMEASDSPTRGDCEDR